MHTRKITPNLLFEYQCTSGKFIRLPNRIESKKIDSVAKIELYRIETFFPELECSTCYIWKSGGTENFSLALLENYIFCSPHFKIVASPRPVLIEPCLSANCPLSTI